MRPCQPDILEVLAGLETGANTEGVLRDVHRTLPYSVLPAAARSAAATLHAHGVRPGDRVAAVIPNSVAAVEILLACAVLGAVWVGINPAAPASERARQLNAVLPRLLITDSAEEPPQGVPVIDQAELCAPRPAGAATPDFPRVDATLPCAIAFSSGTTGTPKAIVHSRAGISLAAASLAEATLQPSDLLGVCLPLSILNINIIGPLCALFAGAEAIILDKMNAESVAAACREHRLSILRALVPATIYDLTHRDDISPDTLASLRVAGTGGAGLPESLRTAFEAKFGVRLVGSYGLSEAPAAVCSELPGMPHRTGASGKALPHVSISARDGAGCVVPAGVDGELTIGPAEHGRWAGLYRPAPGIWNGTQFHARPSADGCLATGDIGSVDAEGHVYVKARKVDVIVRGGVNVTTSELESVLAEVDGVREIVVLGRPDVRLGEKIVAFVELEPAGAGIDGGSLHRAAGQLLSHAKVPDEFVIVEKLPRNAMGKVNRGELTADVVVGRTAD